MALRDQVESLRAVGAAMLLGCLLNGCPTEDARLQKPTSAPTASSPAAQPAPDAARQPAAPDSAARRKLEADARALLVAWQTAQNAGDFAAYQRLYAKHFTGVKRSGPRTRSFDRAGWLEDRKRMFEKPMHVDFSLGNLALQNATVAALGGQSFRSGNYSDRGQKAFTLAYEDGALRIVREEMLASDLEPAPSIAARMVIDIPGGPVLVILGRATDATSRGERLSVHPTMPAALLETALAAAAPDDARAFLTGEVQLVGPSGACSTRGKAVRIAHVAYAHFGQVMVWRGEDSELPKPNEEELSRQIHELDPTGFWAVELASRCVPAPLVAVPGATPVTVYERSELPVKDSALVKRFTKLPFMRALTPQERELALAELTLTRFTSGPHQLVSAEVISGCSAPVVHALFDLEHGGKLGFTGDQGGLEHVEAIADLDHDGTPEIIVRTAIGADTWGVMDFFGHPRVLLKLPYYDCPC